MRAIERPQSERYAQDEIRCISIRVVVAGYPSTIDSEGRCRAIVAKPELDYDAT